MQSAYVGWYIDGVCLLINEYYQIKIQTQLVIFGIVVLFDSYRFTFLVGWFVY